MKLQQLKKKNFALCIDAGEYEEVSLFAFKIYEYIPDPIAEAEGFLRVIDEEEEPYYYDARAFVKTKFAANGLLIPFDKTKPKVKRKTVAKNGRR